MNEDLKRTLIETAKTWTDEGFTGEGDELRKVIEAHDVVFGVSPDKADPNAFGVRLIKGDALLHAIVDTSATRMTALPCLEAAEAEAMRQVFGESKPYTDN